MTFNYDYEYLIHLIYCFIHGAQPEEKPENISFKNVYELGVAHEVANIAFLSVNKLENKPDSELYAEWQVCYFHSVQRDARQWEERELLVDALHKNGVRTLEAQGTVTKKLYPTTDSRMMSDIDFIIDLENLALAEETVLSLGYRTEHENEIEFNAYNQNGLETEFHTDFFTEYMLHKKERFNAALNSAFDHAKPSEADPLTYVLDKTYYYLFSLLHVIKHYEIAGCGIRRILDLYYLKKLESSIDMSVVNATLIEGSFDKEAALLFELEAFWFEGKKPENDLSELIKDVVLAGNHGSYEQYIRNDVRKDRDKGVRFPKLKKVKDFLFPTKEYMHLGSEFLRKHNVPLVLCWIYRLFHSVKNIPNTIGKIKNLINIK